VRGGFLLAGGADADVAGLPAEFAEILGAEVTHAALHAADQVAEHVVGGAGDFLEGLDALGGDLAGGVVLVVAVAGGAAGLHGGEAAHAAVLFVEFAEISMISPGASRQPASRPPRMTASARVRALTMSPDLVMPPSAMRRTPCFRAAAWRRGGR
jgi:hypothetical protein